MKGTTTTTMALVAALALTGIAAMPVQAVPADCNDDFTIPTAEPQQGQSLTVQDSEVGMIEVDDQGITEVRVQLESNRALLEFGVFFLDGVVCKVAADESPPLSNCGDGEAIDTQPVAESPPKFIDCDLEPADAGQTRSYFFHFVNEGAVALEYKAWEL